MWEYFYVPYFFLSSANDTLFTNSWKRDCKSYHAGKGCSKVKIEIVGLALTMTKEEFVIGRFFSLLKRSLQLEITCWCLLDATKEVQSVASASCVELRLQVLEAMWHDLALLAQIIDRDPEGAWFLCEEVRVVFYGLHEALPREEALGQLFDLSRFQTIVIEVKACA